MEDLIGAGVSLGMDREVQVAEDMNGARVSLGMDMRENIFNIVIVLEDSIYEQEFGIT